MWARSKRGSADVLSEGAIWYKRRPEDQIWWQESDTVGDFLFSFDKKRIFSLFRDYPETLSAEEKEIFDRENPYWAEFFSETE